MNHGIKKLRSTERACAEKHVFSSYEEALPQAKQLANKVNNPMSIYQCQVCGLYHISTERTMFARDKRNVQGTIARQRGIE